MSNGPHHTPVVLPVPEEIHSSQLFRIHDRHKEGRREKQYGPMEFWRSDANDGERMLVQLNDATHDGAISLKMTLPICITQHDVWSAVRTLFIRGMEQTSQVRLNT